MTEELRAAPPRRSWQKVSLAGWAATVIFVVGSLGGVALGIHSAGGELVVVATRDLSAFRAISAADVTLREEARSAIPRDAIRSLASVRDHYALQSIDGGQVVVQGAVGPVASAPGVAAVVPVPTARDNAAWIRNGALVDVLLAPTGAGGHAVVIPGAEVVGERTNAAGGDLVFIAVPRRWERAIAEVAGRGQAILAEPPTTGG